MLATGPSGSVVAVWVDARRRVVRATWRTGSGWTPARRLSGKREVAQGPRAASNDLGQVAVTTWEEPHAFVASYEPYVEGDHISLVVLDDGTAWVGDWAGEWDAPQPGPMWVREGDGAWVADDRAPYADEFVTSDTELISWGDSDAVLIRQETLLVWIRHASGTWGPEQVLVQNVTRQNDRGDEPVASASIAPDGTVSVLWGTYANEFPGDHPERGPDLRSVQFSAVAPAP